MMSGNFFKPSALGDSGNFGLIDSSGGGSIVISDTIKMTVGFIPFSTAYGYDGDFSLGSLEPGTVEIFGGNIKSLYFRASGGSHVMSLHVSETTATENLSTTMSIDDISFDANFVYSSDFATLTNDSIDGTIAGQIFSYLESKVDQVVTVKIVQKLA
ncbi:hypothetical protein NU208_001235 [Vibrio parahaemolyticus]|nr:hypothetical protein [Vibrio parahaemolyticus]EGQ8036387.1 hypothetical protein [Vibrio parahaemolyticus]EGQ8513570.1 hypothetical protein [Vibrio parahaemolyticus]EGR9043557.1 hypothetical protein [Vibrio parahaemolyticus]EJI1399468.1 hypothetical protein [Vibrio parahaemolyticus]EJP3274114.1 hypothetical protein [Vibrio parahaemolyticus]